MSIVRFYWTCSLGNALMKETAATLPGYVEGDSAETTYGHLENLVGSNNIRRLDAINSPIADDEYRVALRCGVEDYHFIRQDKSGMWYNKSGKMPGVYVEESYVLSEEWVVVWSIDGNPFADHAGRVYNKDKTYEDDIIYFAMKEDW